jgi:hypothetical protein
MKSIVRFALAQVRLSFAFFYGTSRSIIPPSRCACIDFSSMEIRSNAMGTRFKVSRCSEMEHSAAKDSNEDPVVLVKCFLGARPNQSRLFAQARDGSAAVEIKPPLRQSSQHAAYWIYPAFTCRCIRREIRPRGIAKPTAEKSGKYRYRLPPRRGIPRGDRARTPRVALARVLANGRDSRFEFFSLESSDFCNFCIPRRT